jgi:hypothetical protein
MPSREFVARFLPRFLGEPRLVAVQYSTAAYKEREKWL